MVQENNQILDASGGKRSAAPHFFPTSSLLEAHKIVGLLVGGSVAYCHNLSLEGARDWDGLIVVETKNDILSLLEDQLALSKLLGVKYDDANRRVLVKASQLYSVDAVRFTGVTKGGLKKSVKILHAEHLKELSSIAGEPSFLHICQRKTFGCTLIWEVGCSSLRLQMWMAPSFFTMLIYMSASATTWGSATLLSVPQSTYF